MPCRMRPRPDPQREGVATVSLIGAQAMTCHIHWSCLSSLACLAAFAGRVICPCFDPRYLDYINKHTVYVAAMGSAYGKSGAGRGEFN